MTTQVLLDNNTYLRLAKRIRPAVGRKFGQVPYVLVALKAVEDEVHRSAIAKIELSKRAAFKKSLKAA